MEGAAVTLVCVPFLGWEGRVGKAEGREGGRLGEGARDPLFAHPRGLENIHKAEFEGVIGWVKSVGKEAVGHCFEGSLFADCCHRGSRAFGFRH